ncbi:uncharacterized protein [Panulirus ornatus]|uniref:uncharacterized protein n=1 Tax=Panulirus ornatus TaxID=150431 RepID=UPI003A8C27AC
MLNAENSTLEEAEEDVAISLAATADPVSLARLHLLNAYRRSVQDGAQPEEYRVKWEGHESHLTQQVARLEQDPDSADLTVATRGASIPAHRIVLVAASPFFRSVLQGLPASQHPVIVVRGADPRHLRHVVSFCYSGSIRIPSQDVPEVLQLAKDLEISGLSVVKPDGAALSPSLSVTPPASLRSRVFRAPSPTMFPFTQPMHAHSPPTPALQGRNEEDSLGSLKRDYSPLGLKDTQIKKRCKVEPLASRSDNDLSTLASPRSTPPASAPPLLLNHTPSTHFFRNTHLSPPNSAPPQPVRGLSPRHSSSSPSTHDLVSSPRSRFSCLTSDFRVISSVLSWGVLPWYRRSVEHQGIDGLLNTRASTVCCSTPGNRRSVEHQGIDGLLNTRASTWPPPQTLPPSLPQGLPASQHPVIVVRGADPRHLRHVVSFCYSGSIRIPSQDVPEVLQLAKDLEISGLSVVKPDGAALSPSLSVTPPASLRSRVFRAPSPTMFPFTQPMHAHSPPTPALQGRNEEDSLGSLKRDYSPLGLKDTQIKKRCKVEPLASRSDNDLSTLASPRSTPPASAPPLLLNHTPSTHFFRNTHLSPPNSAPPQPVRGLSPRHSSSSPSTHDLQEQPPSVSLVPSSRLLQPPPAHSSTSSSPHGELPSPKGEPSSPSFQGETSHTSSGRASVPQTPLALALKEPSTPSTPTTPTTPSIKNDSSSRGGVGKTCCSGSRVLLWRFLLDLLHNPRYTPIYIRWLDRPAGIFRIMESDMVAQLWGMARKNSNMNYEKMSRGMRTYYKRGILFHIDGTKLIYKFNTTDPDIQQCMRYYDLSQKSQEVEEEAANEQAGSSFLTSSSLSSLSSLPALQNLPSSVTTPTSMYSPLLRDMQLRPSLLYDNYLSPFLRASQRELY